MVRQEALDQVEAGAHMLDVNVGAAGVDEVDLLPRAVKLVMETVDVPVCIDTPNGEALAAALAVHKELNPDGRPWSTRSMAKKRAWRGCCRWWPSTARPSSACVWTTMASPTRPRSASRSPKRSSNGPRSTGIGREDILIDCLALTVGADSQAGWITLEAIRLVKEELGVNMALGASNVSFGLPERETINGVFLGMAIERGLNCPIVDAAKVGHFILAADLALGRDDYAMRYLKAFRKRQKAK